MKTIIYIGLYLLIVGITIFWAAINAPLVDNDYNIIEQSKWEKWKKKVKSSIQKIGKGEVNNK